MELKQEVYCPVNRIKSGFMDRQTVQTASLVVIAIATVATALGVWFKSNGSDSVQSTQTTKGAAPTIVQRANLNQSINPGTNNNPVTRNEPVTQVVFDSYEHDFGTIKEGEVVRHVFKLTNVGEHPLIIRNARGSCGCTVPHWPKEPIPPGGTAEIPVEFNSKGQVGQVQKTVFIDANTDPSPLKLTIRATVVKE